MNMENYENEHGYVNEIYDTVEEHQYKLFDNTANIVSFLEVADDYEFANSQFLIESYYNDAILHTNSAKYLLQFLDLLTAIRAGYGAFIKCPVCESHKVALQVGNKAIKQSCVDCDHNWDFSLK